MMGELKLGEHVVLDAKVVRITYSQGKVSYGVELEDGTLLRVKREDLEDAYQPAR